MSIGHSRGGPLTTDRLPAENLAAAKQFDSAVDGTPSLPCRQAARSDHASQVANAFVAVVEVPGGKYRRRTYLSLAPAQKAVDRAHEAGHSASVVLCRLVPITPDDDVTEWAR